MTEEEHIEQYIELCKRIYSRMQRDGSWPWPKDQVEDPIPNDDPITR